MAGHTPGPWKVCGASGGKCLCGLVWSEPADKTVATVGVGKCPVQDHGHFGTPNDESLANARLIASAPDLLAACEAAVQVIDGLVAQQAMPDDFYLADLSAIRVAVAKARGENP